MQDGSAYPYFFATEELAQLDQDIQTNHFDGWGEDCVGFIEIEHNEPIKITGEGHYGVFHTKETKIKELEEEIAKCKRHGWEVDDYEKEYLKAIKKLG